MRKILHNRTRVLLCLGAEDLSRLQQLAGPRGNSRWLRRQIAKEWAAVDELAREANLKHAATRAANAARERAQIEELARIENQKHPATRALIEEEMANGCGSLGWMFVGVK